MKYKVEKGVSIPNKDAKYPFNELEKGESFVVGPYNESDQRNMISLSNYYKKKTKKQFIARMDDDKNLRVWRIE